MIKTLNKDLIFLDESGCYLNMTRHYARAFNGDRAIEYAPFRDTAKYSVIGAIGVDEVKAVGYGSWNTDSRIFITFIKELLLPKLNKNHAVIMDN
ncbi:transposase, partial [Piscirickettsia litoralis]|uniref:transposase n=1 Tax=Piscirickettsia litoralis TaxID=1891921 RepID=UPI00191255DD